MQLTDIIDYLDEISKKRNKTGKGMCTMCSKLLKKDYDFMVCKECMDSSFPTEQEELDYRLKHKMCDKCKGEGNVCKQIKMHSICALCIMEGF